MLPKDADGMANSVNPDQTKSSLIWVCTVCPGLSVRKLRIITAHHQLRVLDNRLAQLASTEITFLPSGYKYARLKLVAL